MTDVELGEHAVFTIGRSCNGYVQELAEHVIDSWQSGSGIITDRDGSYGILAQTKPTKIRLIAIDRPGSP